MAFKYDMEYFEYLQEWLNNLEDIKLSAAVSNPEKPPYLWWM
jgi:hypothetical protein